MLDIIRAAAEDNLLNGQLAAYLYCLHHWRESGRLPKGEEVPEGVQGAFGLFITGAAGRCGLTRARRCIRRKRKGPPRQPD